MVVTLMVLLVLGAIGAVDTVYYHVWRCRLAWHPSAVFENITHVFHSVFAAFFFVLVHVRATGSWAWIYAVACVLQAVNQTVDVVLEPSSRAALGGIPAGEYRMHSVINALWGAAMMAVLWESAPLHALPTAMAWAPVELGGFGLPLTAGALLFAVAFASLDVWGVFHGLRALRRRSTPARLAMV